MNKSNKGSMFVLIMLLFSCFFGSLVCFSEKTSAQSSYNIYDATETYGYVTTYVEGAYDGYSSFFNFENGDGVFYGQCIEFDVTSEVENSLYLTVDLGRQLICKDEGVQNMVVTEEYSFYLSAYGSITFTVYAMCMNMYEDAPMAYVYYDLGQKCSGDVYSVVSEISQNDAQDPSGQCALWAVTDSADGGYLRQYGASDNDINRAQGILDSVGVSYNIEEGSGGLPLIWILIIVIIIVVVVVIVVLVLVLRRKPGAPSSVPTISAVSKDKPVVKGDETSVSPKFCISCGAKLDSNAMFCTNCGKKL